MKEAVRTQAGRVSYTDARRYVVSRGWSRVETKRSDIGVFRLGEHEAVLPMDTSLRDYAEAMERFATRVAAAEGRQTGTIVADFLSLDRDLHRPALVPANDTSKTEGASLNSATALLEGVGRGLLAAACTVLNPRSFHPRMSFADAEAFLGATRFASTERGSFVVVLETPLEVDGARNRYGRDVSVEFMRSVDHLATAFRSETPDRVVNPSPGEPHVSSNLCEALLQMAPPSESADLRFAVSWSALLAPPPSVPRTVAIDRFMFEQIEQVAAQLRPSATTANRPYPAFVRELRGEPGPGGKPEGDVGLMLVLEDDSRPRVRAHLDTAQYEAAMKAHGSSAPVIVEGELHRVRRGYELRSIRKFEPWR